MKTKREREAAVVRRGDTALLALLTSCGMAIDAGINRDDAIKAVIVSYRLIAKKRARLAAARRGR